MAASTIEPWFMETTSTRRSGEPAVLGILDRHTPVLISQQTSPPPRMLAKDASRSCVTKLPQHPPVRRPLRRRALAHETAPLVAWQDGTILGLSEVGKWHSLIWLTRVQHQIGEVTVSPDANQTFGHQSKTSHLDGWRGLCRQHLSYYTT